MQSRKGCIYATFLHCEFYNVTSNDMPERKQNHIGYIYMIFPLRGRVPIIKMEIQDGLEFHICILKNDLFKNNLESFPDCENVSCT